MGGGDYGESKRASVPPRTRSEWDVSGKLGFPTHVISFARSSFRFLCMSARMCAHAFSASHRLIRTSVGYYLAKQHLALASIRACAKGEAQPPWFLTQRAMPAIGFVRLARVPAAESADTDRASQRFAGGGGKCDCAPGRPDANTGARHRMRCPRRNSARAALMTTPRTSWRLFSMLCSMATARR